MALDVLVGTTSPGQVTDKSSKSSEQKPDRAGRRDMDLEFKEDDLNSGAVDNQAAAAAKSMTHLSLNFAKNAIDTINMGASDLHFEP